MLIKDVMKKNVVTVPSSTLASDAKKLMKEGGFRRLPVVQITYVISHTTLRDVMEQRVATIKPDATVEQGVALAQRRKVGALVVVEKGQVVGIVTTNDFFYNIVNPTLGLGESGTQLIVPGGGDGKSAEEIIACINRLGVGIKLIWTLPSFVDNNKKDIIIRLDTEDATRVVEELRSSGYSASVRAR